MFINGDPAVTLIHLTPSSFTFFLSVCYLPFPFLPAFWSQCRREQAGAHRSRVSWAARCFCGCQDIFTMLPPHQGCHGQWVGLQAAPSSPPMEPFP